MLCLRRIGLRGLPLSWVDFTHDWDSSQVEEAGDRVEKELEKAFAGVQLPAALGKMPVKYRPTITHDRNNNACWIKVPKGSPVRSLSLWQAANSRSVCRALVHLGTVAVRTLPSSLAQVHPLCMRQNVSVRRGVVRRRP